MLFDNKRMALVRALIGALAGLGAHALLGWLAGDFPIKGPAYFTGFGFLDCGFPDELEWAGIALSFSLFALLGAEVGLATLPFASSGGALVLRTAAHFAITAVTLAVWAGLTFGPEGVSLFLFLLAVLYVLVWLGRWVGWYMELARIREKLGLPSAPSLFHWREALPYVPFALLLCLGVPFLFRLLEVQGGMPVLTGILYPYLLLPVGSFFSALSLGKRQGLCPLYPVGCGGLTAVAVFWLYNQTALYMVLVALLAALAGLLLGSVLRRHGRKG